MISFAFYFTLKKTFLAKWLIMVRGFRGFVYSMLRWFLETVQVVGAGEGALSFPIISSLSISSLTLHTYHLMVPF